MWLFDITCLDQGLWVSDPPSFPSPSTTESKNISISGASKQVLFDQAITDPYFLKHFPGGPLELFTYIYSFNPPTSLSCLSPTHKGQNSHLTDRNRTQEVKSQPGSHPWYVTKPGPEHRSSFVHLFLQKTWKTHKKRTREKIKIICNCTIRKSSQLILMYFLPDFFQLILYLIKMGPYFIYILLFIYILHT